jgi:SAM-dependent methyltransferase
MRRLSRDSALIQTSATVELRARSTPDQLGCVICAGERQPSLRKLFDTRFGVDGDYEVQRCTECGLEQLSPVPTAEHLKDLYQRYYNFGGDHDTAYTRLRDWFFTSPLHRLWAVLDGDISFYTRKGRGRLLDIGCNEGRGLDIYAQNGYEVEGLELNEMAAAVARRRGFAVHTAMLKRFVPANLFDVVVLSNVLEHSPDPTQMLADVRRILKPGGEVWVSCPNSRSWLRSCFGPHWINWHVPFHIVHFSSTTLHGILRRTGFANIRTRQITPSLWVASSAIVRVFARRGRPTRQLRNPFLVAALMFIARLVLFPLLVLGNRLGRGDCLLAVATKEEGAVMDWPAKPKARP